MEVATTIESIDVDRTRRRCAVREHGATNGRRSGKKKRREGEREKGEAWKKKRRGECGTTTKAGMRKDDGASGGEGVERD